MPVALPYFIGEKRLWKDCEYVGKTKREWNSEGIKSGHSARYTSAKFLAVVIVMNVIISRERERERERCKSSRRISFVGL